jgi:hypothetical protein
MVRLLERLRQAWKRPAPKRQRPRLQVEALEDRITPVIAILISHPVPLVSDLSATNAPPVPVFQFDVEPVFNQPMSAEPATSTTALSVDGHQSDAVSEVLDLAGASGASPTRLDVQYNYRVDGVLEDVVTPPPPPGEPIPFVITVGVSGTVVASFQDVAADGTLLWSGTVHATVSINSTMSGTWTQDTDTTTFTATGSSTTFTGVGGTETLDLSPQGGPLPTFAFDGNIQTTGDFTQVSAFTGPKDGMVSVTASSSFSDQIAIAIQETMPAGPDPGPSTAIAATYGGSQDVRFDYDALKTVISTEKSSGMLSENLTPPSGSPLDLTGLVNSLGSGHVHVLPKVALPAPTALAPSGTVDTSTLTFSWTAVPGATHYTLTIVDLTQPTTVTVEDIPTSSWTTSVTQNGDTYIWYVQALDDQGDASAFSNSLTFTAVLAAPIALSPVGTIYTRNVEFFWTAVSGATHYIVTIVDQIYHQTFIVGNILTNSLTLQGVGVGDPFTWTVQALDDNGDTSAPSNSLTFTVAFGLP